MQNNALKPTRSLLPFGWVKKLSRLQVIVLVVAALIIATLIGAWIRHSPTTSSAHRSFTTENKATATSLPATSAPTASGSSTSPSAMINPSGQNPSGRMVIESAHVSLAVPSINDASDHLTQLTNSTGGFVQSLDTSQGPTSQSSVNMVLRIPSQQFTSFLTTVKTLGTVQTFSQSGQDVTEQNNNLQSQLTQLQSEAAAYSRLFQQAQSMKDMLQIQTSLTQVNNQIQQIQQQLHSLHRSVDLATVSITLASKTPATVAHQTPFWGALLQSLAFMKTSALALVTFLAWVLPWGVLLAVSAFIWRLIQRHRQKQ